MYRTEKYISVLLTAFILLFTTSCGSDELTDLSSDHWADLSTDYVDLTLPSDSTYSDDSKETYLCDYQNTDGKTLVEFGQQMAQEHNVFCNMMKDNNDDVAVLNYHEEYEGSHFIVQSYIYDGEKNFIEERTMFKTDPVILPKGNLTPYMIREYDAQQQSESGLLFDTVYLTDNEHLPSVRISQFFKSDLPIESADPELRSLISDEIYDEYAADGWTLEEILSLYNESYDLIKGETMTRNDLTLAFVGYIDCGIFKTRAYIDDSDTYIMFSLEAPADRFQHITNALIDAIEK